MKEVRNTLLGQTKVIASDKERGEKVTGKNATALLSQRETSGKRHPSKGNCIRETGDEGQGEQGSW